ncbi:MAG: NAD(P)/FAD-dependent oxidoreductase [Rhodospirillaceae bacterium]|nr:NAD(P)/FAD-dependent oxidoreductase [Rhodospirillaceae bacterium]MBT6308093.1 NAD(P)/FAD-dependent oxidoreductase [Rhodospirillaceae bacterium]
MAPNQKNPIQNQLDYDAIIIGAGVAGLYQLHLLRELNLKVRSFEAGSGVGGTWYWNRYPGARFDSESWTYGYSFSKELLDEWDWNEHFSSQPENERYLNFVADKFSLREDIQFNSKVISAHYQEKTHCWRIRLEDQTEYTCRFLITAIGILSAPTMPNIDGIKRFKGRSFHTYHWPKGKIDFKGKRIGIIGTGATAIQTIQEVAKDAEHLAVFQRSPNWCAPLHNDKITKEEMQDIRARYPEILARCRETPGCYIHSVDPRNILETSPAERLEFWEQLYASPGFGIWQGNFNDMLNNREANALASEFIANKIRQRVKDPAIAEKLIPKNHGFGTRRVPLETDYYETFNQENVELIDVNDTPIQSITENGIQTNLCEYNFDIIIYATGFDAITGSFDRIDIQGTKEKKLKDAWEDGPQTYLGVFVQDFPNMLMSMGPHAGLGNYTRTAEYSVEWIAGIIQYANDKKLTRVMATPKGVKDWTDYVLGLGEGLLQNEIGSWMTGVNKNVKGKEAPRIMRYSGGHPAFRQHCDAIAADGYKQLDLE